MPRYTKNERTREKNREITNKLGGGGERDGDKINELREWKAESCVIRFELSANMFVEI